MTAVIKTLDSEKYVVALTLDINDEMSNMLIVTRVTVRESENGEEIFLKNKYNYKPKAFNNNRGIELSCADHREHLQYQTILDSRNRRHQELLKKDFCLNPLTFYLKVLIIIQKNGLNS